MLTFSQLLLCTCIPNDSFSSTWSNLIYRKQWCGSGSRSADSGPFGWKRKRKRKWVRGTASASTFCFRFHVSILRLLVDFFQIVEHKYFWVEFGRLFWKSYFSNPVKKNLCIIFHFINIFMELICRHGSGSGSRSRSGLQIFLKAEAEVEAKVYASTSLLVT